MEFEAKCCYYTPTKIYGVWNGTSMVLYPKSIGRLTQRETAEAIARAMNQSPELTESGERREGHVPRYQNYGFHSGVKDVVKGYVCDTVHRGTECRNLVAECLNRENGWHVSGRRKGDRDVG